MTYWYLAMKRIQIRNEKIHPLLLVIINSFSTEKLQILINNIELFIHYTRSLYKALPFDLLTREEMSAFLQYLSKCIKVTGKPEIKTSEAESANCMLLDQ